MTKIEKYFKDDITPNEAYDLLFEFAGYISLLPMNNQDDRINVYNKVMEFLNQRAKPTLTEDEKVILRNIREKKKYIKRFGEYDLVVYDEIEVDGTTRTYKSGAFGLEPFSHLFQFIQPRRRICY